jgi:hypothetical protein
LIIFLSIPNLNASQTTTITTISIITLWDYSILFQLNCSMSGFG